MRRLPLILPWAAWIPLLVVAAEGPRVVPTANATNWFRVSGMHCKGCASGIASELRRTPGITGAEVSLTNGTAVVVLDTNRVSSAGIIRVIREAGYDAVESKP
ncbi:MAG: heavy-metal-associated domain-containing protein [Verrucomicrobiota bacterium]